MGRSISPPPKRRRSKSRDRDRDRDRDRERDREHRHRRGRRSRDRDRDRDRRDREFRRHSRSRDRRRSWTRSSSPEERKAKNSFEPRAPVSEADLEGKTPDEQEMMKLMGFCGFDTSKGKKVEGNDDVGAVHVILKRKYRQYMNRKGGFNRPLDFVA